MRTIILLALVIVVELFAAIVIGMEKYMMRNNKISRAFPESIAIILSFVISAISTILYMVFAAFEIFEMALPYELSPIMAIVYGLILYRVSIIGGNLQIMRLKKRIANITIVNSDNTIIEFKLINNTPE